MPSKINVLLTSFAEFLVEFGEFLISVCVKAPELLVQMRVGVGVGIEFGEFLH